MAGQWRASVDDFADERRWERAAVAGREQREIRRTRLHLLGKGPIAASRATVTHRTIGSNRLQPLGCEGDGWAVTLPMSVTIAIAPPSAGTPVVAAIGLVPVLSMP